jgi:hypothetical protein
MPDFFSRMIDRASGRVPLVRSAAPPQLSPQPFASGEVMQPPGAEPRATTHTVDAGGAPAQPGPHPSDPTRAPAPPTLVPVRSQEAARSARSAPETATPAPLDARAVREGAVPPSATVSAPEATRGVAEREATRASTIEPLTVPDAIVVRPSAPAPTVPPASPLGARSTTSARPLVDLQQALEAAAPSAVAIPATDERDPASARWTPRSGEPTPRPTVLDATRPDATRGTEHTAPSDSPAALIAADRSEVATRAAAPAATHVMRAAPRFELREAIAAVGRALSQPPRPQTSPPRSDEVHITIGHIDVRAAAPPPPAAPARREPSISLAEYLRRPIGRPR